MVKRKYGCANTKELQRLALWRQIVTQTGMKFIESSAPNVNRSILLVLDIPGTLLLLSFIYIHLYSFTTMGQESDSTKNKNQYQPALLLEPPSSPTFDSLSHDLDTFINEFNCTLFDTTLSSSLVSHCQVTRVFQVAVDSWGPYFYSNSTPPRS